MNENKHLSLSIAKYIQLMLYTDANSPFPIYGIEIISDAYNLIKILQYNINMNKKIDETPIHYCTNCLSLKIKVLNDDIDYCGVCGDADISVGTLEEWDNKYIKFYGKSFLTKPERMEG